MKEWLVVLVLIWTPLVCISSVIIGAYIMWCKEKGANPLNDVKMFVNRNDDTKWNPKVDGYKEDNMPGFYD